MRYWRLRPRAFAGLFLFSTGVVTIHEAFAWEAGATAPTTAPASAPATAPDPNVDKIKTTQVTMKAVAAALEKFKADTGRYPTDDEGPDALVAMPVGVQGWKGPYLKNQAHDAWDYQFVYHVPGKHNRGGFDLSSNGPDGQEGTDDDVVNWEKK